MFGQFFVALSPKWSFLPDATSPFFSSSQSVSEQPKGITSLLPQPTERPTLLPFLQSCSVRRNVCAPCGFAPLRPEYLKNVSLCREHPQIGLKHTKVTIINPKHCGLFNYQVFISKFQCWMLVIIHNNEYWRYSMTGFVGKTCSLWVDVMYTII